MIFCNHGYTITMNRQSMRRVIIKQGYLKKIPNQAKFGASFKKPERRWFVYGVQNNTQPYLEYYQNEDGIFQGLPIRTIPLESCRYIIRNSRERSFTNVFCIVIRDRNLKLVASSRDVMHEWCTALESSLKRLGIIQTGENDYVIAPPKRSSRASVPAATPSPVTHAEPRQPTAETRQELPSYREVTAQTVNQLEIPSRTIPEGATALPPPTPEVQVVEDDCCAASRENNLNQECESSMDTDRLTGPRAVDNNYSEAWVMSAGAETNNRSTMPSGLTPASDEQPPLPPRGRPRPQSLHTHPSPPAPNLTRQNSRQLMFVHGQATPGGAQSDVQPLLLESPLTQEPRDSVNSNNGAENMFQFPTSSPPPLPTPRRLSSQSSQSSPVVDPTSPFPMTPNSAGAFNNDSGFGASAASASPPSTPSTPLTPDHPFSTSIVSPKMLEALGVSSDDMIGGWHAPPPDVGAPPPYSPKNQLQKGANKSLKLSQVEVLLKEMSHDGGVRVVLRRADCRHTIALVDLYNKVWIAGWNQQVRPFLHNAFHIGDQVICINGQVVEGAKMAQRLIKYCTSEEKITMIIKRVPYARVYAIKRAAEGENLGFTRHEGTAEIIRVHQEGLVGKLGLPERAIGVDGSPVNWCLTEVNSRPLNLFFKGNEIEHRLNAVGKDISIMVQPMDFIKALKKQLKAQKNHKDFIVQ